MSLVRSWETGVNVQRLLKTVDRPERRKEETEAMTHYKRDFVFIFYCLVFQLANETLLKGNEVVPEFCHKFSPATRTRTNGISTISIDQSHSLFPDVGLRVFLWFIHFNLRIRRTGTLRGKPHKEPRAKEQTVRLFQAVSLAIQWLYQNHLVRDNALYLT